MLSNKELLIIANLRENGRESLTLMSRKTAIPVSTLYERLKHYTGDVIKRHTCLLDFSKLGFHTRATFFLRVSREQRDQLQKILTNHKSVNSVYKLSHGFDFMAEGIFQELKDVNVFLDQVEKQVPLQDKQVYFIVDEIKEEEFLSCPEYLKLTEKKESI
ncbi:Lrp/AsnC family transcriptional regulator [Candidatus Woesearchaeota archaeon]|nr:Lrp/AsnC family transcriptional regulator [Candidatus Woesearchaeota archaeon]